MAHLTRRKFLTRTTAGAAGVGVLAGALGVTGVGSLMNSGVEGLPAAALSGPLMVYVTDAAKGEVTFLVGGQRVTRHDPALVASLWKVVA
jgi:anti-sigma factor RsiW